MCIIISTIFFTWVIWSGTIATSCVDLSAGLASVLELSMLIILIIIPTIKIGHSISQPPRSSRRCLRLILIDVEIIGVCLVCPRHIKDWLALWWLSLPWCMIMSSCVLLMHLVLVLVASRLLSLLRNLPAHAIAGRGCSLVKLNIIEFDLSDVWARQIITRSLHVIHILTRDCVAKSIRICDGCIFTVISNVHVEPHVLTSWNNFGLATASLRIRIWLIIRSYCVLSTYAILQIIACCYELLHFSAALWTGVQNASDIFSSVLSIIIGHAIGVNYFGGIFFTEALFGVVDGIWESLGVRSCILCLLLIDFINETPNIDCILKCFGSTSGWIIGVYNIISVLLLLLGAIVILLRAFTFIICWVVNLSRIVGLTQGLIATAVVPVVLLSQFDISSDWSDWLVAPLCL